VRSSLGKLGILRVPGRGRAMFLQVAEFSGHSTLRFQRRQAGTARGQNTSGAVATAL
jgi:hypothetical protein